MNEDWLYDYYMNQLRLVNEEFISFTQLAREITDHGMRHSLNHARQYQIDRMFSLCRRIRQLNNNPK